MGIFENIQKELEKTSEFIQMSEEEKTYLLKHKSVQKTEIDLNGKKYPAWRIIHNDVLGPGKGGIRFHPNVSEDEVMSLSFWMSIKNSLAGLPYGGAKGGIKVNPKELSKKELENLSREYIKYFHTFLGQDKDIPAPDVYTTPQIMAWMLDEFEKIEGRHEPGMITGKPIEIGGCKIRGDATSKGGVIILEKFLEKINKKPDELKISIQGFGNVGLNVAKMLHNKEYNIIAISDSKGGIISEKGIDIEAAIKYKKEFRKVLGFVGTKDITNEEILESDADILILAALENQITEKNVDKIKAKYILELANGPITFEADETLTKNGVIVLPDILSNSGGVIASYCEWCQNKTGQIHSKEEMEKILNTHMIDAFNNVYELYMEKKGDNPNFNIRTSAYSIAIKKILSAAKLRGRI